MRPATTHNRRAGRRVSLCTDDLAAHCPLDAQQISILALKIDGLSNQQIADALGVPASTVRGHLSAGYKALGVDTAIAALLVGLRLGWLRLNG